MPSLRSILHESVDVCLEQGRCTVSMVVTYAMQSYPEVFEDERDRLILAAAKREAKMILGVVTQSTMFQAMGASAQLTLPLDILPGMSPPLAIAVDPGDGGEIEYVRFDCATWADLEAGLQEREHNIERAVAKRDDFLLKMDALARLMRQDLSMTVALACEQLHKEQNGHA